MRASTALVWLLLSALVAVDLAVFSACGHDGWGNEDLVLTCAWALFMSQTSLGAVWLAWGRGWFPGRMACAALVTMVWSRALEESALSTGEWFALGSTHLVLGSFLLAVLPRLLGLKIVWPGAALEYECTAAQGARQTAGGTDGAEHDVPTAALGRFQFSIGYLLAMMVSLALVLGVLKMLGPELRGYGEAWSGLWPLWYGLLRAAVAWVAVWMVAGRRRWGWKLLLLLVLEGASVVVMTRELFRRVAMVAVPPVVIVFDMDDLLWVALPYLGEAVLLSGYLLVLRMAGMRLAADSAARRRHGPTDTPTTGAAPPD